MFSLAVINSFRLGIVLFVQWMNEQLTEELWLYATVLVGRVERQLCTGSCSLLQVLDSAMIHDLWVKVLMLLEADSSNHSLIDPINHKGPPCPHRSLHRQ